MTNSPSVEQLSINTIRILSADAIQRANSGHPGMPMGAAAMAYTLWTRYLKHNPRNPGWFDRDRFVLSAGHGSALLYSLLHLTGYDVSLDDLKNFRQWGSKTPGHPERGHTPGVEVTTGPLGQGVANAVGMAIAEAWLAARYNRPGHTVVDHYTYVMCGDGDLMEGMAQEAASLAGHLRLGKLICFYDQNGISLAGTTDLIFTEDVAARFRANGWHTCQVEDGNDAAAIARAIEEAKAETGLPSLILVRTHIGFGSPSKQDKCSSHGSPLGEADLAATKRALGWPTEEMFFLPEAAVANFRQAIGKGAASEAEWQSRMAAYKAAFPAEAAELERLMRGELPGDWDADVPSWKPGDKALATRTAGGKILNALAGRIPNLVGGSADLNPSVETGLRGMGDFQPPTVGGPEVPGAMGGVWSYAGRNVAFGVRELGMTAAANGMAAHGGVIPFCSTFFVFSDYMKPAIRLAALMQLKVVFVLTHDSVAVGEDGPTHEPVEQLAGLRAIPGLTILRPADSRETAESWRFAAAHNGPTVLVLTRQAVPHLDRARATNPDVTRGAYVISEAEGAPELLLVGTGSEVALCVEAQASLQAQGIAARVVSMPSWNLFDAQSAEYRESVLPKALRKRVVVEAGSSMGWHRWAGDEGCVLSIDHFGASAPGGEVMRRFGFTPENVVAKALEVLGKRV